MNTKKQVHIMYVAMNQAENNEGIHLINPDQFDMDRAIARARKEGFDVIWIHLDNIIKAMKHEQSGVTLYVLKGGKYKEAA